MAKQLKDILAGTRSVKTVAGNLGKDPGVDYEPKAGDEQKFAALHVHQKHDYPHDNEAMFTGKNIPYSLDTPQNKHMGNKETDAKKGYFAPVKEAKETESVNCNESAKGVECPVHGMVECWSASGKKMNEKDIKEAMTPKQKQYSNRVKTMPGKKGHVMGAASNFEAPFHKVHATVTKNGGAKEVVKHELQAKDKHDAIFNVQMMHHKAGHKIHDVKHKGMVKEETIKELSNKVLGGYVQGATRDALSKQYSLGKGEKVDTRKLMNRRKGIDKAVDKMAKEEVEQIDELSTDLLHRAAHKAAKVAMTDVQGRSGPIFKKRAAQANKFRAKGMEQEKKERAMKEEALDEVLTKSTSAGETIDDFVHSKNPQFAGKSKEKRKEMALAAYYSKQNEDLAVPLLGSVHGSQDIAKYKTDDTQSEIDMVRAELKAIANKTMHMLSNMPADHHIEPWVQSKIAAAKEMIGSVHDYMMYSDENKEDEQTDTPVTFPNMANDSAAGINV